METRSNMPTIDENENITNSDEEDDEARENEGLLDAFSVHSN